MRSDSTEEARPFWVCGKPVSRALSRDLHSPWDGSLIGRVSVPDDSDVEEAVAAAAAASADLAAVPAHVRSSALDHVSQTLESRSEEFAHIIVQEAGKPLRWARIEVARAASTYRWASEEARRWSGTLQRLDTAPGSEGRVALVRRVPKGPVLGITPFNFPLNLVAHKVAPALAVGAPIVLKPAPATPLSSLLLAEIVAETDLPAAALSVLPVDNDAAARMVRDLRLPVISFTGSVDVGWAIRDAAPRKDVVLELGGNAAVIVCDDWDDLAWAADRVAMYATGQAGQACISVQRVLCASTRYDEFRSLLTERMSELRVGDPHSADTVVGPLIDERAAQRVESWVDEAVKAGARLLCGGSRSGTSYAPTALESVPHGAKVLDEEIFGPVLSLIPFDGVEEAFSIANSSRFGLQAGVMTTSLDIAFRAGAVLDVGGVIIGDVPSYRADQMPYGGVKNSGRGREGVVSAMEDLTEAKVLVLTRVVA